MIQLLAQSTYDCTNANFALATLDLLLQKQSALYSIYPTIWAIAIVRKIFYAG
jgi:hypothetical protein